jgi:hypothetical protein
MNPKEKYLAECANRLQKRYGLKSIWIKIISTSVNESSWFDDLIGSEVEIFGIDLEAIPQRYLTENGDGVPFACGEYARDGRAADVAGGAGSVRAEGSKDV